MAKLEECAPGHVAAAERLLGERFDEHELTSLVELLAGCRRRPTTSAASRAEPLKPS